MVNPIQALAALALAFVLPGFFLVKAVFPRHRFSADFHALTVLFLSVIVSVSVTILVTAVLGFLPGGRFQGAATGAPLIEFALAAVTALFAAVALGRGAFPRVWRGIKPAAPTDARETPPDALQDAVRAYVDED